MQTNIQRQTNKQTYSRTDKNTRSIIKTLMLVLHITNKVTKRWATLYYCNSDSCVDLVAPSVRETVKKFRSQSNKMPSQAALSGQTAETLKPTKRSKQSRLVPGGEGKRGKGLIVDGILRVIFSFILSWQHKNQL